MTATKSVSTFTYVLKRWRPELFKVQAGLKGLKYPVKLQAQMKETPYGWKLKIKAYNAPIKASAITVAIPKHHIVKRVVLDGAAQNIISATGASVGNILLPEAGVKNITIEFASQTLKIGKDKLRKFNYVNLANRHILPIVLDNDSDEIDKLSSRRIVAYFKTWYMEVPKKTIKLDYNIITSDGYKGKPAIFIKKSSNTQIDITDRGTKLIITGVDSKHREEAVLTLLRILDKKYKFSGVVPSGRLKEASPETLLLRRKIGLINKRLSEMKN